MSSREKAEGIGGRAAALALLRYDLATDKTLAEIFGWSPGYLANLRAGRGTKKSPKLPYLKIGGRIFYNLKEVSSIIKEQRIAADPDE